MKKVLLTKSQHIHVGPCYTPYIKEKPQNGVSTAPNISVSSARATQQIETNVMPNTYMQRKSFQSIYEDIFKLLMRLPDKALQQRVIDAINGRSDKSPTSSPPTQCAKCEQNPIKVNAATQTDETTADENINKWPVSRKPTATPPAVVEVFATTEPATKIPRKRGRKRNTCVPQVVKRSAAEMAMQEREDKQLTPLPLKKKKLETPDLSPTPTPKTNGRALQRRDSTISNFSTCLNDAELMDILHTVDSYINDDSQSPHSYLVKIMANEFLRAHCMSEEGLLPIHEAVLGGDVPGLQRQVYVWSKLKQDVDLNELLSAGGEDCLQLALTNDCESEIVQTVLSAGVLPNHIYEDSNTALHIAIINNIQLESLRALMMHIDLNLLLLTNDDGYTALHIAVRHNRYKMAEVICDVIDQRQLGTPIYRRTTDELEEAGSSSRVSEQREEKKFAKFYEHACDRLEHNKTKLLPRRLKLEILNGTETRAGNVSLFYAVEGEMEHFCYFLLAHLSDPDEENLSGHSPKSFHYEFARVLRINLKIARIMDKVLGILNGVSNSK